MNIIYSFMFQRKLSDISYNAMMKVITFITQKIKKIALFKVFYRYCFGNFFVCTFTRWNKKYQHYCKRELKPLPTQTLTRKKLSTFLWNPCPCTLKCFFLSNFQNYIDYIEVSFY